MIINDPVKFVLAAAAEYGSISKCVVQYDYSMNIQKNELGCTHFTEGSTVVCINPRIKIEDLPDILAHELAHVICGYNEGHGERWEKTYNRIFDRSQELYKKEMLKHRTV